MLCGAIDPDIVCFEFPTNAELRLKWIQFCSLESAYNLPDRMKLCCYHFKNEDFIIHDQILTLKTNSIPAFISVDKSVVGKNAFMKRNSKEYDDILDCNSSDGIQENEDEVSVSIYDAVQQDIFSTFKDKIIMISEPEEVRSVGNVQVISFVSKEELVLDYEPPKKRCRQVPVQVVKEFQSSTNVKAIDKENSETVCMMKSPLSANLSKSCHTSYLCSVEDIRRNRDLDHNFCSSKKVQETQLRYAGDIKDNVFTNVNSGRKAVCVLQKIAMQLKTKLKGVQRTNARLHVKLLALQDKLIKLTEETIW